MTNVLALPTGTELVGDFRIERVLGAGGFGMTYLAEEIALARKVTIKEYFPTDFAARGEGGNAVPRDEESTADFQWGLDRFIDEAQTLARFDHPNIVRVFRYFRANGTAYMVLTFEEGQSLKGWLRGLGRAPRQRELDDILAPLLEALEAVHAADYLHRDIAPDNIIIRKDGSPVLIDFGSARGDIAKHSRTVSALVKPGYSPYEQYAESGARQGPWTDIYALGATLYHAICGRRPADAPSRVVKDELPSAAESALAAYRPRFLAAIDRALVLDPGSRPQSITAWRGELLAPDPAKGGWFSRATGLGAGAAPAAGGKTVKLTVQPGSLPVPDAPAAAPGQLLDYIEGLKGTPQQPAVDPLGGAAATPASTPPSAERVPASNGRKTTAPKAQPISQPPSSAPPLARTDSKLPAVVPQKTRPARPKPVRFGGRSSVRSFAIKFMLGASIAGVALYNQDRWPSFGAHEAAPQATAQANRSPAPRSEASLNGPAPAAATIALARTALPEASRPTMLAAHKGAATAVFFTADGRSIVTAGQDGTLKVWNAATGSSVRIIDLAEGAATALAIQGRRAFTGHGDGRLALWDIDTGQRIVSFRRGNAAITAVSFARDGERLISSSADAALTLWDPAAPQAPVGTVEAHDGAVTSIAYADRGPFIATGGEDNAVRLWRASDLSLVRSYRGHRDTVSAVSFSPDGRYLAAAAIDGRIRVWSTSSSSLYRLSSGHKAGVRGLAFSPGGDMIASAADDGTVQLWLIRQSKSIRAGGEGGAAARSLSFAPDGARAAVANADGSVRFWDAAPMVRASR